MNKTEVVIASASKIGRETGRELERVRVGGKVWESTAERRGSLEGGSRSAERRKRRRELKEERKEENDDKQ